MNPMPDASKTPAMFALQCFFDRPFHSSGFPRSFPLFIFVLLMTILVSGSAAVKQGFFLIGAWEHTGAASNNNCQVCQIRKAIPVSHFIAECPRGKRPGFLSDVHAAKIQ
jgi:hypothetical protein